MATLEELIVKIEADNKELKAALEESAKVTARSSKQMEDAINKFAESASKEVSRFDQIMNVFAGTTLANIAVKGAEMAAEAFGFLKDKFVEGIDESLKYEQQITRLANSLAANGKFTQTAIDDLERYIGSMEDLTAIDDEVIASNLSVLSSMTRLSSDGLQRAQTAAINLSAALGIDLDSATKMVGKASEGSTDAFKKWGINIDETADKGLTFENTLKLIEKRFGSAAAGNMKTFGGSVDLLKSSFGNLFQALGDVVVKNPAIIAAINELSIAFKSLTEDAKDVGPSVAKSIGQSLGSIIGALAAIAGAFEDLIKIFSAGWQTMALAVSAIKDSVVGVAKDVVGGFKEQERPFAETEERWKKLNETVSGSSNNISNKMFDMMSAVQTATSKMGDKFENAKNGIDNATDSTKKLTWAQQEQIKSAQEFATQMAQQAINVQNGYQLQQDALQISLEGQLISFETYKEAKLASQLDLFNQELALIELAEQQKKITPEQARLAELAAQQKHNNDQLKLKNDLKKQEEVINNSRLAAYSGFFGNLATLSKSGNQKLAEVGKAAALVQGTIDMYSAIMAAYKTGSQFGPATAIAFATAAGVAQSQNLAKIAGIGLATGIDSVPGVGAKDNFPAMLMPGERVVPTETNKDLTEFLARQGSQPQQQNTFNLIFNGPVWSDKATAGSDIIDAINEAAARGMGLRLLNT